MPNEGQLAESRILRQFESDPRVQQVLAELERREKSDDVPSMEPSDVKPSGWLPENLVAVDGSLHPLPLSNGFPSSQICYYSIVSVLLKIAKMRVLDEQRPVPPALFKEIEQSEIMTAVVTGANVVRQGESDPQFAFRNYLFEALNQNGVDTAKETLLQTYEHLLRVRPAGGKAPGCPYEDCADPSKYDVQDGSYECGCKNKYTLFSTDPLDVHNSMSTSGDNGRMFGEALQVIEALWLINIIRFFVYHAVPQLDVGALDNLAFVMDGPLRIDGEPAWLSRAIRAELKNINEHLLDRAGKDLLLLGIEKTGNFVEHFKLIDTRSTGSPNRLPPQTLFLLDNDYIRNHIAPGTRQYGDVTYYGRKFFYKSRTGALICGCTPMLRDEDADLDRVEPERFPRLADALTIIDELASARYPNAIIPVLAAHAEAAIPLSQGRKVLAMLTAEHSNLT